MPEITYALRVAVINDVLKRAKSVGAYHAFDWLEHHLKFLETENNDEAGSRTDEQGSDSP